MLLKPLQLRYVGLDLVDGQWRLYVVLPSIRKLGRPHLLAALAFAMLGLQDRPARSGPNAWQTDLVPSGAWGRLQIERRGDIRVTWLEAQLSQAPLDLVPVGGRQDGQETDTVDRIARHFQAQSGRDVIGAVNGGFFDLRTGLPIGFMLRDRELDFFNMPQGVRRSMMGVTESRVAGERLVISSPAKMPKLFLDRVSPRSGRVLDTLAAHQLNVRGGKNAFALFTSRYGRWVEARPYGSYLVAKRVSGPDAAQASYRIERRLRGSTRIHIPEGGLVVALQGQSRAYDSWLPSGSTVRIRWTVPQEWRDRGVVHGLLAGPRLVQDGRPAVTADEERLSQLKSRDRMVIGEKANGQIVLAWLHHERPGANLDFNRAARLVASLGVRHAIGLDGGSSRAVLAVVKNPLTDDRYFYGGRPVANAVVLARR